VRQLEIHVRRFVAFLDRVGGSWEEAWEVWAPLVLSRELENQVRGLVQAELIARGVLVPPLDYELPEREAAYG
jgi:hypothetical protein